MNMSNNRYINKDEANPNNNYQTEKFSCPECGSYNTGSSTKTDFCNTCGWTIGYS